MQIPSAFPVTCLSQFVEIKGPPLTNYPSSRGFLLCTERFSLRHDLREPKILPMNRHIKTCNQYRSQIIHRIRDEAIGFRLWCYTQPVCELCSPKSLSFLVKISTSRNFLKKIKLPNDSKFNYLTNECILKAVRRVFKSNPTLNPEFQLRFKSLIALDLTQTLSPNSSRKKKSFENLK